MIDIEKLRRRLFAAEPYQRQGKLTEITATLARARLPGVFVGERCDLDGRGGQVPAEVVAVRDDVAVLIPFDSTYGLSARSFATPRGRALGFGCGEALLGRLVDPMGRPQDGLPSPGGLIERPLWQRPPPPLSRLPVERPLPTGLRAIDAMAPLAMGQRVGVLAPAGVGKSTILGRLSREARVDAVVVALCGERGREIQDFMDREISSRLGRTAVIAAAADAPPMARVACALAATTLAEFLRDQGKDVLLLVDSLTRVARAQREVGLAAGEPPTRRGFPPSVPQILGKLLERAANSEHGTLSAVYTVLVEGDDPDDPVAEEARALLDGHLWLSRALAERGRYPAIDPVKSLSRLADRLRAPAEQAAARKLRALISTYEARRDLLAIGAYEPGRDKLLDEAVRKMPAIETFLNQERNEKGSWEEAGRRLVELSR